MGFLNPQVDLVVLKRDAGPLHPEVERGIREQVGVQMVVHRVVGNARPADRCRWDAIARARNEGMSCGQAPWLMFLDDDVVLTSQCVSTLINELSQRPLYGAFGADYLGECCGSQVSGHVAMGATLFRREALKQVRFTWRDKRCECQCCCDDLRRLHWAIDYCPSAKARHLPKGAIGEHPSAQIASLGVPKDDHLNGHVKRGSAYLPSVCFVVYYLGPLPGWFTYYLMSCAYNPSIDFLIFTDQEDLPAVPANVQFKHLSRSSFNALATNKIGAKVSLSCIRKLCDFKPVYGHLFEEFLEGWDYWGYTDLDVIYGDLRHFLSAAKLQEYDLFTARKEFLVGHFTLMRNSRQLRTLYQQSADFQATLQAKKMLSFDECGQQWQRLLKGKPLNDNATCDSMTHVVRRLVAENKISACFSPAVIEWPALDTPERRLRWKAGRLWVVNERREAMYCHFHTKKSRRGFREPRSLEANAEFEISPQGFDRVSLPMELAWK